MGEKQIFRSLIYNRNSYVYIWYLVASWACEVTLILTQKRLHQLLILCMGISVNIALGSSNDD